MRPPQPACMAFPIHSVRSIKPTVADFRAGRPGGRRRVPSLALAANRGPGSGRPGRSPAAGQLPQLGAVDQLGGHCFQYHGGGDPGQFGLVGRGGRIGELDRIRALRFLADVIGGMGGFWRRSGTIEPKGRNRVTARDPLDFHP